MAADAYETTIWALQDAKARFSELVRRARAGAPQHVTVHGEEAVVVVASETYARLNGPQSGAEIVAALAQSPIADLAFDAPPLAAPIRDVAL